MYFFCQANNYNFPTIISPCDFPISQVMDFVFVVAMGLELGLKVLAEGMLFTPKALIRDLSGMLDIFIFVVSLIWVCWMPQVK